MLLVSLQGISNLLVIKFWESGKLYMDFRMFGGGGAGVVSTPNPCVLQGSTLDMLLV